MTGLARLDLRIHLTGTHLAFLGLGTGVGRRPGEAKLWLPPVHARARTESRLC